MNSCLQELLQLIAAGQAEDATSKLIIWLADCRKRHPEGIHEVENLQGQVVVLSGNLATAQRDFLANLITRDNHNLAVARVSQGLLRVINNLDDYTVFSAYLEEVEEEVAWEKALEANSMEVYEDYFRRYPKGKYVLETERLMNNLREDLKRRALEEKKRRDFFTKISPLEYPGAAAARNSADRPEPGGDLQSWWDGLPPAWRKALINEIGHFGKVGEKQLQRILGLKTIDLSNNPQIQDIEPLRHMASIQTLLLNGTPIADLGPLTTVRGLRKLDIRNTRVQTLQPLVALPDLSSVVCSRGKIVDLPAFRRAKPSCHLILN
ncbi:leucine-rich repeat domain-containing protein [Neolewinella persica]|uniref:leucine-rich repeat domain-containing protein n=1 Tax=Neolewinella persica TaxID=70998 RepID=UPI0003696BA5|nr:leucine-rich repeat domain-containing protein [Neolewinella persica]